MQSEDYVIEKTANGWVITSGGKSVLICARRKAAEVAVRMASQALKRKISLLSCGGRKRKTDAVRGSGPRSREVHARSGKEVFSRKIR